MQCHQLYAFINLCLINSENISAMIEGIVVCKDDQSLGQFDIGLKTRKYYIDQEKMKGFEFDCD